MQQKNLVLFIVLSLVILLGWAQLQRRIWPPKPVEPAGPESAQVKPWRWPFADPNVQNQVAARLFAAAAPTGVGLDTAGRLVAEAALVYSQPDHRSKIWLWPHESRPVQAQNLARLLGSAAPTGLGSNDVGRVAAEVELARAEPRMLVVAPRPTPCEIVLGNDASNLRVVLSSEGASVRQVVLNKFQEADVMGLPMWKPGSDRKVPEPLELVPMFQTDRRNQTKSYNLNDPFYHYLLFHYAQVGDDRPVETLAHAVWKVDSVKNGPDDTVQEVVFSSPDNVPGLDVRFFKKYTLQPDSYDVGLEITVQNKNPEKAVECRYQLAGAHGLPIEGEWYTSIFRNALFCWIEKGKAWRNLETGQQIGEWMGGDRLERGDSKVIRYAAVAVQYFTSALVVDDKAHQPENLTTDGKRVQRDNFIERARATVENPLDPKIPRPAWYHEDVTVRAVTEPLTLQPLGKPGDTVTHRYVLYNGPVKVRLLGDLSGDRQVPMELVQRYEDQLSLNTLTDYHSPGAMGRFADSIGLTFLIIKATNVMHWLLWVLHSFVMPWSYGLCIILLTVVVRGIMFPISRKQAITSQEMQAKMAKLSPELKKIREKYKDDFQALGQAQQELYRRHGVNPFATMGGCLLLLAQMPIFLGLYYALQESIFLRLAPFFSWLPWIPNLAAPDMLFGWGEKIPFISSPDSMGSIFYLGPFFNLLPIVAVSLMIVQQKLMTPPPADEQQEMQQKMMKYMMVFIGVMFYKVAAGLCVYFIASSLWGLAERKLNPKAKTSGPEPAAAPATTSRPRADGRRPDGRKGSRTETRKGPANGTLQKMRDWWADVLEQAKKKGR